MWRCKEGPDFVLRGFRYLAGFIYMLKKTKWGDLTQSYDKSPYTNRNVKRAKWQHKQRHKNSSKQRLQTDLGRSIGVTTASQLVWLTSLDRQSTNTGTVLPGHRTPLSCNVIRNDNLRRVSGHTAGQRPVHWITGEICMDRLHFVHR